MATAKDDLEFRLAPAAGICEPEFDSKVKGLSDAVGS